MTTPTALALIAGCLLVQGFFSGSEIAIVGSDRLLLRSRAEAGDRGARRVLDLLGSPTRLVGTCLIGTNLATIAGATLAALVFAPAGRFAELGVVLVYTPVSIIFAELVPKSLYLQYASRVAPVVAVPIAWLAWVFGPLLVGIEAFTRAVLGIFGASDAQVNTVRREDIRLLLDSADGPDIRSEEKDMIRRVFHFSEKTVGDAMIPLIEVVGISDVATVDDAIAVMIEQGYSRLPVYRRRVDRIVGVVSHQDLLYSPDGAIPVATRMTPVIYVPETKPVGALFLELRRKRQRLAIAVDEFGGAVGLITIEDILEEIVGDIGDEYDREAPLVRRVGERAWVANARVEGETLERYTGFLLPDGEHRTLAGFMLQELGHVPASGERVVSDGYTFVVSLANERAILEVAIAGPEPAADRAEDG